MLMASWEKMYLFMSSLRAESQSKAVFRDLNTVYVISMTNRSSVVKIENWGQFVGDVVVCEILPSKKQAISVPHPQLQIISWTKIEKVRHVDMSLVEVLIYLTCSLINLHANQNVVVSSQ